MFLKGEATGKLIVFEGTDCSFKETNAKMLYTTLKRLYGKDKVVFYSFPRYEHPASYFVRQFLQGEYGPGTEDDIYKIAKFYTLDRYDAYIHSMKEELLSGKIVICDRYSLSNCIYSAGRLSYKYSTMENYKDRLHGMTSNILNSEFIEYGLPVPDVTFFMQMPLVVQKEILAKKKDKDINELNTDLMVKVNAYYSSVISSYLKWMREQPDMMQVGITDRINCSEMFKVRNREVIFKDIMEITRHILPEIKWSNNNGYHIPEALESDKRNDPEIEAVSANIGVYGEEYEEDKQ